MDNLENNVLTPAKADDASATTTAASDTSGNGAAGRHGQPGPDATSTTTAPGVRRIEQEADEPVDLMDVAGGALAKRLAPIGILALLVLLIVVLRKRRAD